MSKLSDYYNTRGYNDITDYEYLAWRREQELNEQWEEEENKKTNHGKYINEDRIYNGSGKADTYTDRT